MLAIFLSWMVLAQIPDEVGFFSDPPGGDYTLDPSKDLYSQIEARRFSGSCWSFYDNRFAHGYMADIFDQNREMELIELLVQRDQRERWAVAAGFVAQAHCPAIDKEEIGYDEAQLLIFDSLTVQGIVDGLIDGTPEALNLLQVSRFSKSMSMNIVKSLVERVAAEEKLPDSFSESPRHHSVILDLVNSDFQTYSTILGTYLRRISGRVMMGNLNEWDAVVKPAVIAALSHYNKPEGYTKTRAYYDLSFHLLQLRSAFNDPITKDLGEKFLTSADPESMSAALLRVLQSNRSAAFFAQELLVYYLSDEVWDELLKAPEAALVRSEILSAILQRKRISKEARRWIEEELSKSRNPLKAPILNAIPNWGESGKDLLWAIWKAEGLMTSDYETQRRAMAALSIYFDVSDLLKKTTPAERQLAEILLESSASKEASYHADQARQIFGLVNLKSEKLPYDQNKERKFFTSSIYYFERHWSFLDPQLKAELKNLFPLWMQLPPDKLSDEAMLRLLNQMKAEGVEWELELVSIEKDLREGLGLK